jgi:hypothetical protein
LGQPSVPSLRVTPLTKGVLSSRYSHAIEGYKPVTIRDGLLCRLCRLDVRAEPPGPTAGSLFAGSAEDRLLPPPGVTVKLTQAVGGRRLRSMRG